MSTATETTETKEPKSKMPKPGDDTKTPWIDIALIKSNKNNPRESAPTLTNLGYGIFHKLEGSALPAVVPMALSDKTEDKAEYIKVIDKSEPAIVELAKSIITRGQLQNATVRPDGDGGYDLVIGCRRLLAILYNHCQTGVPARIRAVVTEENIDAVYASFDENLHRLNMSPIEQARWFGSMKKSGMKVQEIADRAKIDHQIVRQRMELLKLPTELQQKVHEGDLPITKALKIVKGKADPTDPKKVTRGSKGGSSEQRRRAPTLSELQRLYEEDDSLHEEVRKWIAGYIEPEAGYKTFKELQKIKAEAEKAEEAAEKNGKDKGKKK